MPQSSRMTQVRLGPNIVRDVDVGALSALLGVNKTAAARRLAGPRADKGQVEAARRQLQRALASGRVRQATAQQIAAAWRVPAESFLQPYERPDPRLTEIRRLRRRVAQLERELGLGDEQEVRDA